MILSSLEATLNRIERLATSGTVGDVAVLVRLLGDLDWQTRCAAAEAISTVVDAHAAEIDTEKLFDTLIAAAGDTTDAGRRAAAIAALEGIGERVMPRVMIELERAHSSARISLAGLAGTVGGAEAVRLLGALAQDADTNVAAAAITALGHTRDPHAADILFQKLDSQDDWLRFATIGALGELGDARAIERIEPLLEEPLMEELAASALAEIATLESGRAIARHLRARDGSLRPAVLTALVSICADDRCVPHSTRMALRNSAPHIFLATADAETFDEILRMTSDSVLAKARAGITLLGWMGEARAVPVIEKALDDPSLVSAARTALADLARQLPSLDVMLDAGQSAIAPVEIVAAIANVKSFATLEAAARVCVEAMDAETLDASAAALAQGRDWLQQQSAAQNPSAEASHLVEKLRAYLTVAEGRARLEIAETLGVIARIFPAATARFTIDELTKTESDEHLLARLAFLVHADSARATKEAIRAQRHRNARLRMAALEILGRCASPSENISLALHLTDESSGVRRAAARALRRGAATVEARRVLLAALDDEDIWVRAEATTTLGALFGDDAEVHARLREALIAPHPVSRVAAAQAISARTEAQDRRMLSEMARRDAQAEARRAAVQAFARCAQSRTAFSVARAALKDAAWPVRHAAVETLASSNEARAINLLQDVAANPKEAAAVRGAALRALALRGAEETIRHSCVAISECGDATLVEDAFAALVIIKPLHQTPMRQFMKVCAPRAASVINFILENENRDEAQTIDAD